MTTPDMLELAKQNIAELTRKLEQATAELDTAMQAQKGDTIAKIVAMMNESNITLKDLKGQDLPKAARGANKKNDSDVSRKQRKTVPPKYEHKASGTLWTGRGAKPSVFKDMTDEQLKACLIKPTVDADQSNSDKPPIDGKTKVIKPKN